MVVEVCIREEIQTTEGGNNFRCFVEFQILRDLSHCVNISAFPGFHEVNNDTRGSLFFCDLFILQLLGENSNPQTLENSQKR